MFSLQSTLYDPNHENNVEALDMFSFFQICQNARNKHTATKNLLFRNDSPFSNNPTLQALLKIGIIILLMLLNDFET